MGASHPLVERASLRGIRISLKRRTGALILGDSKFAGANKNVLRDQSTMDLDHIEGLRFQGGLRAIDLRATFSIEKWTRSSPSSYS